MILLLLAIAQPPQAPPLEHRVVILEMKAQQHDARQGGVIPRAGGGCNSAAVAGDSTDHRIGVLADLALPAEHGSRSGREWRSGSVPSGDAYQLSGRSDASCAAAAILRTASDAWWSVPWVRARLPWRELLWWFVRISKAARAAAKRNER
jgi:hypothetical protein